MSFIIGRPGGSGVQSLKFEAGFDYYKFKVEVIDMGSDMHFLKASSSGIYVIQLKPSVSFVEVMGRSSYLHKDTSIGFSVSKNLYDSSGNILVVNYDIAGCAPPTFSGAFYRAKQKADSEAYVIKQNGVNGGGCDTGSSISTLEGLLKVTAGAVTNIELEPTASYRSVVKKLN